MILLCAHLHHKPQFLAMLQGAASTIRRSMSADKSTGPMIFEHSTTEPMTDDDDMPYMEISATTDIDDEKVCKIWRHVVAISECCCHSSI